MSFSPLLTTSPTFPDASHQALTYLDDVFSSWNLVNSHNPMLSDSPSSLPALTLDTIPQTPPVTTAASPVAKKAFVQRIPRPLNSFMTYRKVKQHEVMQRYPKADNRDISRIVAAWWNQEPEHEKEKWRRKAEEGKRQHAMMFPGYKYCPQKKSAQKKCARSRHADSEPNDNYKVCVDNDLKKRLDDGNIKTSVITQKQLRSMLAAEEKKYQQQSAARARAFTVASSRPTTEKQFKSQELQPKSHNDSLWDSDAGLLQLYTPACPPVCPPAPQPQPQDLLPHVFLQDSLNATGESDSLSSKSELSTSPQSWLADELAMLLFGAFDMPSTSSQDENNAQKSTPNYLPSVDACSTSQNQADNPLLRSLDPNNDEHHAETLTPLLQNTDFCLLPSYDIHEMLAASAALNW